jgi:hypothetical protein
MKLSKLEQIIYDCAMEKIADVKDEVMALRLETRFIEIPFMCEGCIDSIVYDTEIKKFIKITYRYGIGKGIVLEGNTQHSAYFDDYEIREIKL